MSDESDAVAKITAAAGEIAEAIKVITKAVSTDRTIAEADVEAYKTIAVAAHRVEDMAHNSVADFNALSAAMTGLQTALSSQPKVG
ncbi:MAG: hypothetical protein JWP25_8938 [Bradyrhizobium sp.]|nr:hypothetical protein [Bradyrhizobium sp.]